MPREVEAEVGMMVQVEEMEEGEEEEVVEEEVVHHLSQQEDLLVQVEVGEAGFRVTEN